MELLFIIGFLLKLCFVFVTSANNRYLRQREREQEARVRCTRRFTPGVCLTYVAPVWTYQPQTQNCTERLGCIIATQNNRFSSYRICMSYCKPLRELYHWILAYESQMNETEISLRTKVKQRWGSVGMGRREWADPPLLEYDEPPPTPEDLPADMLVSDAMYVHNSELDGILPPDIDKFGIYN